MWLINQARGSLFAVIAGKWCKSSTDSEMSLEREEACEPLNKDSFMCTRLKRWPRLLIWDALMSNHPPASIPKLSPERSACSPNVCIGQRHQHESTHLSSLRWIRMRSFVSQFSDAVQLKGGWSDAWGVERANKNLPRNSNTPLAWS